MNLTKSFLVTASLIVTTYSIPLMIQFLFVLLDGIVRLRGGRLLRFECRAFFSLVFLVCSLYLEQSDMTIVIYFLIRKDMLFRSPSEPTINRQLFYVNAAQCSSRTA